MSATGPTTRLVRERTPLPFSPGVVLASLVLVAIAAFILGSGALGINLSGVFGDAQINFDRNPRGNDAPAALRELNTHADQRPKNPLSQIGVGLRSLTGGQPPAEQQQAPAAKPNPLARMSNSANDAALSNSANDASDHPLVSQQQAEQLNQAAELAAQEASEQYTADRQLQESQAPLVVRDGVTMDRQAVATAIGRDPCSVPRADPKTCQRGIPQATPINSAP